MTDKGQVVWWSVQLGSSWNSTRLLTARGTVYQTTDSSWNSTRLYSGLVEFQITSGLLVHGLVEFQELSSPAGKI